MDLKVCGKLLMLHRRGYGVDVEALRDRFPLRQIAGKGPKMGSHGTEACGGGKVLWWMPVVVWASLGSCSSQTDGNRP